MITLSIVFLILALALFLIIKPHEAVEVGHKNQSMKRENLRLQSREKGPVPPSRANSAPFIPVLPSSSRSGTTNQKRFVGPALPSNPPPAQY